MQNTELENVIVLWHQEERAHKKDVTTLTWVAVGLTLIIIWLAISWSVMGTRYEAAIAEAGYRVVRGTTMGGPYELFPLEASDD